MAKEKCKIEKFEEFDDENGSDSWGLLLQIFAVLIMVAIVVVVILVLLGPIVGNTYSDDMNGISANMAQTLAQASL